MIVQCAQCQTRFKIPDEKVTERGVKVRCTRCQHTFRVARGGPAPQAASPSAVRPAAPAPAPAAPPGPVEDSLPAPPPELTRVLSSLPQPPSQVAPAARVPAPPAAVDESLAAPPPELTRILSLPQPPSHVAPAAHVPRPPPAAAALREALPAPPPPPPEPSPPPDAWGGDPFALEAGPAAPFALHAGGGEPLGVRDSLLGESLGAPRPTSAPAPLTEDIVELSRASGAPAPARLPLRASLPPAPAPAAAVAPVVVPAPPPPPPAGGPGALLVNVLLAALLCVLLGAVALAGVNEGSLSLGLWRTGGALPAAARPLAPRDVSNGLYDTRSGRPVFYVRGEVENRGSAPTRVQVRVEVLDGAQRLRTATGLAGATASPEDLFALDTPQDGEALRARLDREAQVLAPGARAPFLLVFVEYPPQLGRYRLQVTAEPAGGPGAAAP